MTVPLPAVFQLDSHDEIARLLHLRDLLIREHPHIVLRELERHAPQSALPERARVLRTVQLDQTRRVLAEVDGALVLLETWKNDAHVIVSSADEAEAAAVADEVKARVPRTDGERRVEVMFSEKQTGTRRVVVDVVPWDDARSGFAPPVQSALDRLVRHRPDPASARRLVLWHGTPGTGKTSAVRSLVHAWRDWADAVVVTDPEALLSDGRYLRRLILDVDDDDDERWQLLVLEDAEGLLRKETGGRAMSTLLNLTDGLLGQGVRCLFLITTNEHLAQLHPAIVRPGRCLAQVEFGPLPAAQAAALLGRPAAGPMTLAEVYAARPVEVVEQPAAVGQSL